MSLWFIRLLGQHLDYSDEPSTGMDPVSRRKMWEIVRNGRQGRTTIITTHWMEEADALCDRIGIMVNGQFACLGTSQHLVSFLLQKRYFISILNGLLCTEREIRSGIPR